MGDFVKTLGDYELGISESTFQQDNDPTHTVTYKIVHKFLNLSFGTPYLHEYLTSLAHKYIILWII